MSLESITQLSKSAEKSEKSQEELRSILKQKLFSLKPTLENGIKEYEQLLEDGGFEDQEGEAEGAGESRKIAMQNKLNAIFARAERVRSQLDSKELLPQEPLIDLESLKTELAPFFQKICKEMGVSDEKIKNTVIKLEVIDPKTEDYQSRQTPTNIDPTKFGEFTVNPDTQDLDWETLKDKIFIPDLSSLEGKTLKEIADYLIANFSDKYKIPGIEFCKFMIENPDKVPSDPNGINLKDGNLYINLGSIIRDPRGVWNVSCVQWRKSWWDLHTLSTETKSRPVCRVVLLKI